MKASDFTEKRVRKLTKEAQESDNLNNTIDSIMKFVQENPEIITTLAGAIGGGAAGGTFGDSDSLINKWTGALAGGGAGYAAPGLWNKYQNRNENTPIYENMNGLTEPEESVDKNVQEDSEGSGFPLKETAFGAGLGTGAAAVGGDYLRNLRKYSNKQGQLSGKWDPNTGKYQKINPKARAAGDTAKDLRRILTLGLK